MVRLEIVCTIILLLRRIAWQLLGRKLTPLFEARSKSSAAIDHEQATGRRVGKKTLSSTTKGHDSSSKTLRRGRESSITAHAIIVMLNMTARRVSLLVRRQILDRSTSQEATSHRRSTCHSAADVHETSRTAGGIEY